MTFDTVTQFEQQIASYYNSPYAIATDCCTHAVELALRHTKVYAATCPAHTYISIPFTFKKLGIRWSFEQNKWSDYYQIGNSNIIDAAVYFKEGGYIPDTFMCLSFQFKKPLSLGRGGAILCDREEDYIALKKMSYDGRYGNEAWADQDIDTIGYHYYMTPETAQMGIDKLPTAHLRATKQWSWQDYPDLSTKKVFCA